MINKLIIFCAELHSGVAEMAHKADGIEAQGLIDALGDVRRHVVDDFLTMEDEHPGKHDHR